MEKISSINFYNKWLETVNYRKTSLLEVWRNHSEYTKLIKGSDTSVIKEVANKLNLNCYPNDYYFLDSVLYGTDDMVPRIKDNTFWFKNIQVAFEHENKFDMNLYTEVSHLLITNCDLRVLVSYPNNDNKKVLDYLHEIIKGSRISESISNEESFLIILGYENHFEWEGFVYKHNDWWKKIY